MKKILIAAFALCLSSAFAFGQTALTNYQPGPRLIDGSQLNKMVAAVNNLNGTGTAGVVSCSICKAGNGTVSLPSITFASDLDTGLYRIGANNIGVAVNAAKVLDIGTTGLGITGVVTSGAHAITSASANALVVGLAGATNPAFNVDASTASSATGLNVKSAAAAGGLAVAVISSGTDENLTLNAKGAGTVTINGTATGNIVLGRATTGVSFSGTGALTAYSALATPAAASSVAGLLMGSAGIGIYWGTGTPAFSSVKGSIYIKTDGGSTSDRLFINNGTTSWVAITTAS